jgi:hypothetical protein
MQFGDIHKSFVAAGLKPDIVEVTVSARSEVLIRGTQATWKASNLSTLFYEPKFVISISLEE